jgi:hypothetical protein
VLILICTERDRSWTESRFATPPSSSLQRMIRHLGLSFPNHILYIKVSFRLFQLFSADHIEMSLLAVQASRFVPNLASFKLSIHSLEVELLVYFFLLGGQARVDLFSMSCCPALPLLALAVASPPIPSPFRFKQNHQCFS